MILQYQNFVTMLSEVDPTKCCIDDFTVNLVHKLLKPKTLKEHILEKMVRKWIKLLENKIINEMNKVALINLRVNTESEIVMKNVLKSF